MQAVSNDKCDDNKNSNIIVVGAGIIGVLSALQLQREGHQVTLIDRESPGNGCSFGNAGILARSSFVPLSSPSTLLQAPSWLLDPNGPLCVRWRYLPRILPWLFNYIKAGFKTDLVERGEAVHRLTDESVTLYKALAQEAGCETLVVESDYLQVYRTKTGFEKGQGDMNARRRLGFKISDIDERKLHQLEPSLSAEYKYAHHLVGHGFVKDPQGLLLAMFEVFKTLGGKFIQENVVSVETASSQPVVITTKQRLVCDKLVIAAGAFSARVLKKTGIKIPLETERGYHFSCPKPGVDVTRPIMDGELKFFVTPMNDGHRFAGLVELAGLDLPLQEQRVKVLANSAQKMLPEVNTANSTSWLGFRPTFSDSLPAICNAPDNQNVVYAFGHQHLGLTCAPMTALLVADLVAKRTPRIDVAPYDIQRFG
jgi:D-amino-acid dehydrogenase